VPRSDVSPQFQRGHSRCSLLDGIRGRLRLFATIGKCGSYFPVTSRWIGPTESPSSSNAERTMDAYCCNVLCRFQKRRKETFGMPTFHGTGQTSQLVVQTEFVHRLPLDILHGQVMQRPSAPQATQYEICIVNPIQVELPEAFFSIEVAQAQAGQCNAMCISSQLFKESALTDQKRQRTDTGPNFMLMLHPKCGCNGGPR
jgi:hypothetical protein